MLVSDLNTCMYMGICVKVNMSLFYLVKSAMRICMKTLQAALLRQSAHVQTSRSPRRKSATAVASR